MRSGLKRHPLAVNISISASDIFAVIGWLEVIPPLLARGMHLSRLKPVPSALCDYFQAEIGCDAPEGRRKIRQMQTTETKSAGSSIAPVQTATRTDGTTNIDALPVSTTFVARASVSERRPHVEEDSTDIFLLERCSPLNDF